MNWKMCRRLHRWLDVFSTCSRGSGSLRWKLTCNLCSPFALSFHRFLPLSPHAPHLDLQKSEMNDSYLPRLTFPGRSILIQCPEMEKNYAEDIMALSACEVLGFDTESKPIFYTLYQSPKRPNQPVSVIQLSSQDTCIVWQLKWHNYDYCFPPRLRRILQSKNIVKVGHASARDALLILRSFHVNCRNVFDTYEFVSHLPDVKEFSLKGLCALFLAKCLVKPRSLTLSNWDRECLTTAQLNYACTDAWASLEVYHAMLKFAAERGVLPPPAIKSTWNIVKPQVQQSLENDVSA